jgi:hypothetical protein
MLEQQDAFDKLKSPKKIYWTKGKGHLSMLTGEGCSELIMEAVRWLQEAVGGDRFFGVDSLGVPVYHGLGRSVNTVGDGGLLPVS